LYTRFEDLQLAKELGSGQFGVVKLAINKVTKSQFAVKIVQKSKLKKSVRSSSSSKECDSLRERGR
jgi:serine/threonine protein kinase